MLALLPSLTPLPLSLLSDRGPFVVCFHSISRPLFVPIWFAQGPCWASCQDYEAIRVLRLEVEFCFWLVLIESCCYSGLDIILNLSQGWIWNHQGGEVSECLISDVFCSSCYIPILIPQICCWMGYIKSYMKICILNSNIACSLQVFFFNLFIIYE